MIIDESNIAQQPAAEETPVVQSTSTGRTLAIKKIYASKASATRRAREKYRELKGSKQIYDAVTASYKTTAGEVRTVTITEKNLNKPEQKESRDTYAPPTLQASADNVRTLRHVYANRTNAIRAAQSEYRRMVRGVATFSISLALGRPELHPEMPAQVKGWKDAIDSAEWQIARVTHSLSNMGYNSMIDLFIQIERQ